MLARPSADQIRSYLNEQQDKSFSYSEAGATAQLPPEGYTADHHRVQIGHGESAYKSAIEAVLRWRMFDFDWIELCWPEAPVIEGTTVAIVARHFGFWSINSCRIVYVVNLENGPIHKFGFAYGTLPDHAERGEERFVVEWNQDDNSVWYDLLSFSKPNNLLVMFGYPLTRALQKQFATDSMQAMTDAVKASQ